MTPEFEARLREIVREEITAPSRVPSFAGFFGARSTLRGNLARLEHAINDPGTWKREPIRPDCGLTGYLIEARPRERF